jgi:hypothetical protein
MNASIKAAKKVTVRRFARAAVIVALLSTPGAAQQVGSEKGTSVTMPDNCKQNLDWCSQKVWPRDSFPRTGWRQTITFSNGATLTCTSNGPAKPRSCTLNEHHGEDVPAGADTPGKK